ncbi:MAG TPA: phage terminase large subunit, partial [Planctomycetota bacterium]|nr:phage terminase large subunit [Planctomycetota bacterium]
SNRVEREIVGWLRGQMVARARPSKGGTTNEDGTTHWIHLKSENALECSNGSRIEFKSAHNADYLRGAGLDLLVVGEAADVAEDTWVNVLKPMLLDRNGEAYLIGTPRGKNNWLHRVFLAGQQEHDPQYASLQLPTRANPRIKPQHIEEFRNDTLPEDFKQEYEAEFIDGVGTIFANVEACIDGELLPRGRPGTKYVTGIDLGQKKDFTVLCSISCADKRVEGFARFNELDWSVQEARILEHLKQFPGPAVVDATAGGQVIYERLRDKHVTHVERFVFSGPSREEIITGLQTGIAHQSLKLANAKVLIDELNAFTQLDEGAGPNRRVKTGAPAGLHDDCVMALGLAWWGLEKRGLWGASLPATFAANGMFAGEGREN